MTEFDPAYATIPEISKALDDGAASATGIAEMSFSRIESLDPQLNAFVRLTRERALREAAESDARRSRGENLGPLDGVPYAVKDIFDVAGLPTMAGSRLLSDNVAQADCTAVKRLSEAGMVMIGKTHTVQFAASINGTNKDFGTPINPWHREPHLPGGSSSGSAVAVAAGLVPIALGSDTGGSIRLPAALTGITGFKPTCGRLGRGGVRPLAWSEDTIGPLTRTARDGALVFEVMQGPDSEDEGTWNTPRISPGSNMDEGLEGLNIVVCETVFFDNCDPRTAEAVETVSQELAALGATVSHREIPIIEEILQKSQNDLIFCAESYAVNQIFYDEHLDELDPEIQYVIAGRDVSVPEYYRELRKRFDLQWRFSESLGDAHAILTPTSAQTAWPLSRFSHGDRPPVSYARNTAIGNYLNLSSVSVPCAFDANGLPIGAMISARPFDDEISFRIAHAYQKVTAWHESSPDLSWI